MSQDKNPAHTRPDTNGRAAVAGSDRLVSGRLNKLQSPLQTTHPTVLDFSSNEVNACAVERGFGMDEPLEDVDLDRNQYGEGGDAEEEDTDEGSDDENDQNDDAWEDDDESDLDLDDEPPADRRVGKHKATEQLRRSPRRKRRLALDSEEEEEVSLF